MAWKHRLQQDPTLPATGVSCRDRRPPSSLCEHDLKLAVCVGVSWGSQTRFVSLVISVEQVEKEGDCTAGLHPLLSSLVLISGSLLWCGSTLNGHLDIYICWSFIINFIWYGKLLRGLVILPELCCPAGGLA